MNAQPVILRNASALVASQVVIKIINIAVSLMMVRWLGPSELGLYAYILAFCYPFGALTDLGLGTLAIREISRDPGREGAVVSALTRLLLALTVLSGAVMLLTALLVRSDARTLAGIAIVAAASPVTALITPCVVLLNAREELHLLSLFLITASALGSAATLATLLAGGRALSLLLASAGTNLAMLGGAKWLAGRRGPLVPVRYATCRDLLIKAVPFGLVLLGFTLYYRLDMIMLRWFRDAAEVGRYAAAYRFLDALLVLGAALGGPFYPRLSSLVGQDARRVREILEATWRLVFALGLPLVLGTFFVAGPLTLALFGPEFQESAGLVRILIWGGLPILLIVVPGHTLNAADRVWYLAAVYGIGVLANFSLNLVLIPRWGAEGAALATVGCAWLCLGLVVRVIQRDFGALLSCKGLWRYLLATAGMGGVLWFLRPYSLTAVVPLAMVAYAAGLLLLGYRRSQDLVALKQLLGQ